jgi:quercetin dioxygenase-like cupin family protein
MAVREEPIDLAVERARLEEDPAWKTGTHSARALLNEPEFSIVLLALKQGAAMREHRYEGRFTLQTLGGNVRVRLPERVVELPAGRLLVVGPRVVHDVQATQESTCLLTLVKP